MPCSCGLQCFHIGRDAPVSSIFCFLEYLLCGFALAVIQCQSFTHCVQMLAVRPFPFDSRMVFLLRGESGRCTCICIRCLCGLRVLRCFFCSALSGTLSIFRACIFCGCLVCSLKCIHICFFLPLHFLFQTRNVCIKECTVTVFLGELCLQRSLFSLAHAQEVTFFLCFCLLFLLIGQQFFQARLLFGTLSRTFLMLSCGVFQLRPALLNAL